MKRREFITLLGGAAASWPGAVWAQQAERVRRVGLLIPGTSDDAENQTWVGAFLQGLQQSGWTIGSNLRIDARFGGTDIDAIRKHAVELVASAPDVVLADGNGPVAALRQVSRTLPIVFPVVGDPVGTGLSPAWRGRAAISLAFRTMRQASPGSGWRCSRRSNRVLRGPGSWATPNPLTLAISCGHPRPWRRRW